MKKPEPQDLASQLAKRACDEYIASVAQAGIHPMTAEAKAMSGEALDAFALFFQDLAELVALADEAPEEDQRASVVAQSARLALARHPNWMRVASDLASGLDLEDPSFAALGRWINP